MLKIWLFFRISFSRDKNKAGGLSIDLQFLLPSSAIVIDLVNPEIKIKNLSKSFGYLIKKLFFDYVFLVNILHNSFKESSVIGSNLFRINLMFSIINSRV